MVCGQFCSNARWAPAQASVRAGPARGSRRPSWPSRPGAVWRFWPATWLVAGWSRPSGQRSLQQETQHPAAGRADPLNPTAAQPGMKIAQPTRIVTSPLPCNSRGASAGISSRSRASSRSVFSTALASPRGQHEESASSSGSFQPRGLQLLVEGWAWSRKASSCWRLQGGGGGRFALS